MAAEQVTGGFVVCSLALPNHTIAEVRMLSQKRSMAGAGRAAELLLDHYNHHHPSGKARYAPHGQPCEAAI